MGNIKDFNNQGELENYIINHRRWFHMYPELSFEEEKTAEKIKEELTKLNIEYQELEGTYSLIGTISGNTNNSKKVIGIRADFDALPIQEETNLEFTSKNDGVMHSCGHDAHTAMLLGTAKFLSENKDKIDGTIKLIFQAAEERSQGIQQVLDYFEETQAPDEVIGIHIWSGIEAGEVLLIPEAVFSGNGIIDYKIIGQGGHGARPDLVKDPIKASCDMVLHLSQIPSNYHDVLDNAVVSICCIEGGNTINVFPTDASIKGTYRYLKPMAGKSLREAVQRVARGIESLHDVKVISNSEDGIPPVYNNPEMIKKAIEITSDINGLEVSKQKEPISASDNYGKLLEKYNGIYAILGGKKLGETFYPHHHPKFDIDEGVLIKGAEFMTKYT
ncbi:MAG: M20 family metallopeptidase, partial [bacterium]